MWDHPDVMEFFNFDNLDIGKSYAERAHAANAGNGVGHGLRYIPLLFILALRMRTVFDVVHHSSPPRGYHHFSKKVWFVRITAV